MTQLVHELLEITHIEGIGLEHLFQFERELGRLFVIPVLTAQTSLEVEKRFLSLLCLVLRRELMALLKHFGEALQFRHASVEILPLTRLQGVTFLGILNRLRLTVREGLADFAQILAGFTGALLLFGGILRLLHLHELRDQIYFVRAAQGIAQRLSKRSPRWRLLGSFLQLIHRLARIT